MRLIIAFLLLSLSASAQSEKPDTVKCYGRTELEHIVMRVVRARECDTLLMLCEKEKKNDKLIMEKKDAQIDVLNKISADKENIIVGKEVELAAEKKNVKKAQRQKALLKAGWLATTIILLTSTLYFIIN